MTKKELKRLATEIAKQEKIIQQTQDSEERYRAEMTVMNLTNRINNGEEMTILDDLIQKILEKN